MLDRRAADVKKPATQGAEANILDNLSKTLAAIAATMPETLSEGEPAIALRAPESST